MCLPEVQAQSSAIKAVKLRAEAFLETIRQQKWGELTEYTVIEAGRDDESMRSRLGIHLDADRATIEKNVEIWFRKIYGSILPGPIISLTIDSNDRTKALIQYRHGDLDAFEMHQIDGEWYYYLD